MGTTGSRAPHGNHYVDTYTPPTPPGGVRRAVPRDALTGEPIRSDTLHIRVRDLDPRQSSGHSAIVPQRRTISPSKRAAIISRYSSAPLPALRLDDLVDDALDDDKAEEDDTAAADAGESEADDD